MRPTTMPVSSVPENTRDVKTITPVVQNAPAPRGVHRWLRQGRLLGIRLVFALKHPLRSDEWGLLLPMNLGDTYVMCALVEAFRAHHGGRVTVFVKPAQRYIPTLFPGIDCVVVVPTVREMWCAGRFELRTGIPFVAHHSRELRDMLGFKGLTMVDANRSWLGLPLDAPLAVPRRPSADEDSRAAALFDRYSLPAGRTVLLAPESNTAPGYSLEAWGALAEGLRAAGWHPVTNGGPKGHVVPGTERVDIPLDLCLSFVERAGWLLTMRTGLADVVSSARARLTVFYPPPPPGLVGPVFIDGGVDPVADWYQAFSLVRMGLAADAEEILADEDGFRAGIPALVAGLAAGPPEPAGDGHTGTAAPGRRGTSA